MEQFRIAPTSLKIYVLFFAFAVVLPGAIAGAALLSRPIFDWPIFLLAAAFLLVVFFAVSAPMFIRHSIVIDDQTLKIEMAFYSQSVNRTDLIPTSARIFLLSKSPELRMRLRTNGIGLPGYQVGWFILNNDSKAFAAITSDEAVYVQTTKGYSLLFSADNAKNIVAKLTQK